MLGNHSDELRAGTSPGVRAPQPDESAGTSMGGI